MFTIGILQSKPRVSASGNVGRSCAPYTGEAKAVEDASRREQMKGVNAIISVFEEVGESESPRRSDLMLVQVKKIRKTPRVYIYRCWGCGLVPARHLRIF